jgi:arginase family enzyme
VFFDAHGDFNTWDTTPSGFLGGDAAGDAHRQGRADHR